MGKGEYDLSEMFIVSKNYKDKAEKFVRLHGELNYAQGGSFEDVLQAWKDYGIVPESVMNGLQYGEDMHVHNELESAFVLTWIKLSRIRTANFLLLGKRI